MAMNAGVWIDHHQAIVVLMTDAGQEIKKFVAGAEQTQPKGSERSQHKYTPNDFIAEDRRERKLVADRKKVYSQVLDNIKGVDSLLILGPGEAKGEFNKHITSKRIRGLAVDLETTDKMTDRQLAAKVKAHFAKVSAAKTVVPKTKAKTATKAKAKLIATKLPRPRGRDRSQG